MKFYFILTKNLREKFNEHIEIVPNSCRVNDVIEILCNLVIILENTDVIDKNMIYVIYIIRMINKESIKK